MTIFKDYISPNSCNELNIANSIKKNLEKRLESGTLGAESLMAVFEEVLQMVYLNTYPKLLSEERGHAI